MLKEPTGNLTVVVSITARDVEPILIMPLPPLVTEPKTVKTTGSSETPGPPLGVKKVTSESPITETETVSAVSFWTPPDQPPIDLILFQILSNLTKLTQL